MLARGGRNGLNVVEGREGRVECWRGEGGKGEGKKLLFLDSR